MVVTMLGVVITTPTLVITTDRAVITMQTAVKTTQAATMQHATNPSGYSRADEQVVVTKPSRGFNCDGCIYSTGFEENKDGFWLMVKFEFVC